MDTEMYKLWEIPMGKPSVLYNALKYVNQGSILKALKAEGGVNGYHRAKLMKVADLAIQHGFIKTIKAEVPTKGILTFVDLESFPQEFESFIAAVIAGASEIAPEKIAVLLAKDDVSRHAQKKISFRGKLLAAVTSKSWLLPLAEWWCGNRPEKLIYLASRSPFPPGQNTEEILGLLHLIKEKKVKEIFEIGTSFGGTLYLFSKMAEKTAHIVTIDLTIKNKTLLPSFGRNQQRITLIESDSTLSTSIDRIKQLFPDGIDFLFIDGDHSYEGVKKDFDTYARFVKSGGMIAFHDIVEDNETRYGVITGGWSGGVPRFWAEIKSRYKYVEFVKNCQQDGLGIGVIFWPGGNN